LERRHATRRLADRQHLRESNLSSPLIGTPLRSASMIRAQTAYRI
jgi:hypothetical protein